MAAADAEAGPRDQSELTGDGWGWLGMAGDGWGWLGNGAGDAVQRWGRLVMPGDGGWGPLGLTSISTLF